jgi:hypothetical protein
MFHTQKLSSNNIGMRIKPTLRLLLADLGLELVMTYSSAGCEHRRLSLSRLVAYIMVMLSKTHPMDRPPLGRMV